MTALKDMVGRVVLHRGLGDEPGELKLLDTPRGVHAYVFLESDGQRVHVPFSPTRELTRSDERARTFQLGIKVDHSSGDELRTSWSIEVAP